MNRILELARRSPELRQALVQELRQSKRASQVGRIILEQMGGPRRLSAFLGARNLEMFPRGVAFQWPNRQRSRGNKVRIELTPMDTYTMTFSNVSVQGERPVKVYRDVYADQLVDLFEKQTGWYLRL